MNICALFLKLTTVGGAFIMRVVLNLYFAVNSSWGLYYKTFYGSNCWRIVISRVFNVSVIHFHPSLISAGKARSLLIYYKGIYFDRLQPCLLILD
jgi:hypothetical protein